MKTILKAPGYALMVLVIFVQSCRPEQGAPMQDPQNGNALSPKAVSGLSAQYQSWDVQPYDHALLYDKLSQARPFESVELVLPAAAGKTQLLTLHRNDVVEDDFYGQIWDGKTLRSTGPLGIRTFSGTTATGGTVSLTLSPELISGFVEEEGEAYILESAKRYDPAAGDKLVILPETANKTTEPLTCGNPETTADTQGSMQRVGDAADITAQDCWQIKVMVHGDYHYLRHVGAYNTAVFYMVASVNDASTRFAAINIHLHVPNGAAIQNSHLDYWSNDAQTLLNQVTWTDNNTYGYIDRDINMYYTGRNIYLNGDYGVAGKVHMIGALCANPGMAYGVSETKLGTSNSRVQSHEFGHLIGAPHDGACPGGLMYPYYNSSCSGNYPTQASYNAINAHIWYHHNCISMAPGC